MRERPPEVERSTGREGARVASGRECERAPDARRFLEDRATFYSTLPKRIFPIFLKTLELSVSISPF